MVDAGHGEDVEDHVGARDEQHREEVEHKACQRVRHPARALKRIHIRDILMISVVSPLRNQQSSWG